MPEKVLSETVASYDGNGKHGEETEGDNFERTTTASRKPFVSSRQMPKPYRPRIAKPKDSLPPPRWKNGLPKIILLERKWSGHTMQDTLERQLINVDYKSKLVTNLYNRKKWREYTSIQEKHYFNLKKVSAGPPWFQDLSFRQMSLFDNLMDIVTSDFEEGVIGRTQRALMLIGVCPLPSPQSIWRCMKRCNLNILVFIFLIHKVVVEMEQADFEKRYLEAQKEGVQISPFSVNERILLSGVFHVHYPIFIRKLDKLLPPPKRILRTLLPRRVPPPKEFYESPYLEPVPIAPKVWYEQRAEDDMYEEQRRRQQRERERRLQYCMKKFMERNRKIREEKLKMLVLEQIARDKEARERNKPKPKPPPFDPLDFFAHHKYDPVIEGDTTHCYKVPEYKPQKIKVQEIKRLEEAFDSPATIAEMQRAAERALKLSVNTPVNEEDTPEVQPATSTEMSYEDEVGSEFSAPISSTRHYIRAVAPEIKLHHRSVQTRSHVGGFFPSEFINIAVTEGIDEKVYEEEMIKGPQEEFKTCLILLRPKGPSEFRDIATQTSQLTVYLPLEVVKVQYFQGSQKPASMEKKKYNLMSPSDTHRVIPLKPIICESSSQFDPSVSGKSKITNERDTIKSSVKKSLKHHGNNAVKENGQIVDEGTFDIDLDDNFQPETPPSSGSTWTIPSPFDVSKCMRNKKPFNVECTDSSCQLVDATDMPMNEAEVIRAQISLLPIYEQLKAAVKILQERGDPLAILPDVESTPWLVRWFEKRNHIKWPLSPLDKMDLMEKSKRMWENPYNKVSNFTLDNVPTGRTIPFDKKKWLEDRVKEVLSVYHGRVRRQLVDNARDLFPSMYCEYFTSPLNKHLREIFFTYFPSRELDTYVVRPWFNHGTTRPQGEGSEAAEE